MGPMERRERDRLALRRKILDAGRRLFAEQGYEAVTMRTIAHEIEYSPRTIYLHFKDKDDLIRELCRQDFHAFGTEMAKLAGIADPIERLRAAGKGYAAFAQQFPNHYQLMFMTRKPVVDRPEDLEWHDDPEADAYAFVRACLSEAHDKGMLRTGWSDPDLAAQVVWAALHGVLALHITHREDPFIPWAALDARVDGMIRLIVSGLRAEPPPVAPKKS
ncbi:MAG: TetR/AcrR family transcriptional regulator [Acidobacteria bacterium]|nr:TetR/AcrR family transcriptional regulator [Acidobacteriota bacterium]